MLNALYAWLSRMKLNASLFLSVVPCAFLLACGSATPTVTNSTASVPSVTAPLIAVQPNNQTVTAGQTATFSVTASGSMPLSYQWRKGATEVAGATAATYTTPATAIGDNATTFSVVVSNAAGSQTSNSATLTVTAAASAPSITRQPSNQSVNVGQTASFSVTASGSMPLSYQWQKGGIAIGGATEATYTTAATAIGDNASTFSVVVSNAAGSQTSSSATLTVTAAVSAPIITQQPNNQTAIVGQTVTFSVVASGSMPLSYQWQKGGIGIAGATAASYTTPATVIGDNGSTFMVVVSNSVGAQTSTAAKLTVTAAASAPSITKQPSNQTVNVGQTATFSVTATGSIPLRYQWKKDGTAIAGATGATYTTPATTISDNGSSFLVVVSNSVSAQTSDSVSLTVGAVVTGTDVSTYKNDLGRTGQNLTEKTLTLGNVNSASFGLLRKLPVDARVDAQPLYLSQLSISGVTHNVVFAATERDSVYAFDADTGTLLWHVTLLGTGESPSNDHGCAQVTPDIGVTSTPVIDRHAGTHGMLYVVAMSVDAGSNYHQRLHALDITTGAELLNGPTEIAATFTANSGNISKFDPKYYEERAALTLSNGVIYTTWTSHCDAPPYSGWIIAHSQSTLAYLTALNIAANSNNGPAIWMSGGGPAVDAAGDIYLLSANGAFETTLDAQGFPSKQDFGNSFLKLSAAAAGLSVLDYFTMSNEIAESSADRDLGSGGEMLLPDLMDATKTVRHLVIGAGKDSNIYLVDRDSMGKFSSTGNNIFQMLTNALPGGIWSTPAYFNGTVFYGDVSGTLKAFSVTNAKLGATPQSQSATQFTYPGTAPSVSADGTVNGIVWAHENSNPAVLHAYDATNLAHELYNSTQAPAGRDKLGAGNKYITPTVADGKVFIGTPNSVAVFGLLP
jgi:Immunoglobulin I-set domain